MPEVPLFKNSIVDVRCHDNHGRQFIVEMQMLWTDSFKARVLFNASKAYVSQLSRGRQYEVLQPVYAPEPGRPDFRADIPRILPPLPLRAQHRARALSRRAGVDFRGAAQVPAENLLGKRMQVLWLRYLTEIRDQTEQIPPELLAEPALEEAVEYLRESAFTRDELAGLRPLLGRHQLRAHPCWPPPCVTAMRRAKRAVRQKD